MFNAFTHRYSLSKTLRFELKPVGHTQAFLDNAKVFVKDKIVQQNYELIKPFFDELHRIFVKESLENVTLDRLHEYYVEFEKIKKAAARQSNKKDAPLAKEEEKLRKNIVGQCAAMGDKWGERYESQGIKIGKKGIQILFGQEVLSILASVFPRENYTFADVVHSTIGKDYDGNPVNVFRWFIDQGFTTYLSRLHPSRENFYSAEAKDTAIANRIINENLARFADNIWQYEQKKEEYQKLNLTDEQKDIFKIDFYNNCLLQNGIDAYNEIIGGSDQKKGGIRGLNQQINEYNQQHHTKIRQFKKLYKQILSPKEKRIMNDIEKPEDVFLALRIFIELNTAKIAEARSVLSILIKHAEDEDFLAGIHIKGTAINTLSGKFFSSWETLKGSLMEGKGEKAKLPDFIALNEIRTVLLHVTHAASDVFKPEHAKFFSDNHWKTFLAIFMSEFESSALAYDAAKEKAMHLMISHDCYIHNDEQNTLIKSVCDRALDVFSMMRYFALEKGKSRLVKITHREEEFYEPFENYYYGDESEFSAQIIRMYDNFRNFVTKKPYSQEKWKLNFEKSNLLKGWGETADDKKAQYGAYILRKESKYFLAVSEYDKFLSDIAFPSIKSVDEGVGCYYKLEYKQLNWGKNIAGGRVYPSFTRLKLGKELNYQDHKKMVSEKEHAQFLLELIEEKYLSKYPILSSLLEKKYTSPRELQLAFEKLEIGGMEWLPIKKAWIEGQICKKGKREYKLFLFEIRNKDSGIKVEGRKNLHTIYWNTLFSAQNQSQKVVDLGANAEIFFRPQSLKIEEENRNFSRKIVKNKRYTQDKIFLHCPILLNANAEGDKKIELRLNTEITNLKHAPYIIGIDRGEKHLAYYSVLDSEGKIVETGSFNEINGVDYHKKLLEKTSERNEARKDWKNIATIKELKHGYVSLLVRKICDLMLKYQAVVVLENLNSGFKRGRSALDFPVYQKLELALAKKLNFLVRKDAKIGEIGHPLLALQLTPPVQNFQDIEGRTQIGALLNTTAAYTSTICPRCGWRKNYYISYKNIEQAKKDFAEICISFDQGVFRFAYRSESSIKKTAKINAVSRDWQLYSNVPRYKSQKINGPWEVIRYESMTEEFKKLFLEHGIDITRPNITDQLTAENLSSDFWKNLVTLWNLLCQIRNTKEREDVIHCPACYFNSNNTQDILPLFADNYRESAIFNGDANGAYNIARKGSIMINRIKLHDYTSKKYPDLLITQEDWDSFLSEK